MDFLIIAGVIVLVLVLAGLGVSGLIWKLRSTGLGNCLTTYVAQSSSRQALRPGQPVHMILCVADHYEPDWGAPSAEVAQGRVETWLQLYPQLFAKFRDHDGRPPRHSFFYPLETYQFRHLDGLAQLCRAGFGEVEVHLHHDGDNAEDLRGRLLSYKQMLAAKHGLLSRLRSGGEICYGFIHGNWALDNSLPNGRYCGVNNELDILRETGCYADFTLPSVPSRTQTRKINSIYYAQDDPHRPKSHDWGIDAGVGKPPDDALLLIQGPLLFDWRHRKWGFMPRIENACLQGSQPPSMDRLLLWLRAHVQVPGRPDWFFVKLHTHGAPEANQRVLLGEPMVQFHSQLQRRSAEDRNFHYHYVTAREMYNLVKAAEDGWVGTIEDARDYRLVWNSAAPSRAT